MSKNVSPQSSANAAPLSSLDLGRTAFLLDFDGTLVDIVPQPEAVHASALLRETLAALHAASGDALAIISGRTVYDVESCLSLPGLVIAGVYGIERRYVDGGFVCLNANADVFAQLERELRTELTQLSTQSSGTMLESKGIAFALHYRHTPEIENAVLMLADRLARSYAGHVRLQAGKMVVGLKPRDASKGDVVHTLMTKPPFMGHTVLFAGDNLADESAFNAANALDGWPIKVGASPSQARWRVPDAAVLRAWLVTLTAPFERDAT